MNISYPNSLPISSHRDEVLDLLKVNPVLIISGDTGSGKTTQLPKMAYEYIKKSRFKSSESILIGCTQPRRLATISMAKRLCQETESNLGSEVGYKIRFQDKTSINKTQLKFMTDGILLSEIKNDKNLSKYDFLIIDEAHERSLNIDFLLGYLKRILKIRKDFRLIISSATLNSEVFSDFFDKAPIIKVDGRMFPVEDIYQEPISSDESLANQILRAINRSNEIDPYGDILIFLPGEREIHDIEEFLNGYLIKLSINNSTQILKLFSKMKSSYQDSIFKFQEAVRKIILSTNIAETSLTIPGIKFVIDSGLAKVNRYNPSIGIQKLQIEPISKANSYQRRGRCGRVSEGVCIKLYSQGFLSQMPEYSDSEIIRSNLTGVVLQMEYLRLGSPLKFPFITSPKPKQVFKAWESLQEIGALKRTSNEIEITELGNILATFPLDPKISRIILESKKENCLKEALIVASALSVQDPRERPKEEQTKADEAHKRFHDKKSDFTVFLKLWFFIQKHKEKSNNELRRFCKKSFLSYQKVQEWINIHNEILEICKRYKWIKENYNSQLSDPTDTYLESLHRCILSSIPSNIGFHKGKKIGYKGSKNSIFHIFPGSSVFKKTPLWVMSFEIVETTKRYARNVALFNPIWMEKTSPHLCKYKYTNPHWNKMQGAVYGYESVAACGLPIIVNRPVHYGRINIKTSREIFIKEALINGNTRSPIKLLGNNIEVLKKAYNLECKTRRVGGLVDLDLIFKFYDDKIPLNICTQNSFEKWLYDQEDGFIDFKLEDCLIYDLEELTPNNYPDKIYSPDKEVEFDLTYVYSPGKKEDGVSVYIPLVELFNLPEWFGDWLIPGWLPDKIHGLIRCLNKEYRSSIKSKDELVREFLSWWEGYDLIGMILDSFIEYLKDHKGINITKESFNLDRLTNFLRMNFIIIDDNGNKLTSGNNLGTLKEELKDEYKARFYKLSYPKYQLDEVRNWDFGNLPESIKLDRHTIAFPRLCNVGITYPEMRIFKSLKCASFQHDLGLANLYISNNEDQINKFKKNIFLSVKKSKKFNDKKYIQNLSSINNLFGSLENSKITSLENSSNKSTKINNLTNVYLDDKEINLFINDLGIDPNRNKEDFINKVLINIISNTINYSQWNKLNEMVQLKFECVSKFIIKELSEILKLYNRIINLLSKMEDSYQESKYDINKNLNIIFSSGWVLSNEWKLFIIALQGIELRINRILGSSAIKDEKKIGKYYEEYKSISYNLKNNCECMNCPESISKENIINKKILLRLKIFSPELLSKV